MSPAHTPSTDAEPVYSFAPLIDHHRRAARRWPHPAAAIQWDAAFTALTDATRHRQAITCLLEPHHTGPHHLASASAETRSTSTGGRP